MTVALLVIEAVTPNLVTIWFAFGALASLITAFFGGGLLLQLIIFLVVTAATLALTRPLVKKLAKPKYQATNADALIGSICTVLEDIDNIDGTGSVSAGGKVWTARSLDGTKIIKGEKVEAIKIEGVKLIVKTTNQ